MAKEEAERKLEYVRKALEAEVLGGTPKAAWTMTNNWRNNYTTHITAANKFLTNLGEIQYMIDDLVEKSEGDILATISRVASL